jgi:hypothetical protein
MKEKSNPNKKSRNNTLNRIYIKICKLIIRSNNIYNIEVNHNLINQTLKFKII